MDFNKETVLWVKIDLEALTISDLTDEEKSEIKDEINLIRKRNPDVDEIFVVFQSQYDEDVMCDENFEEIE